MKTIYREEVNSGYYKDFLDARTPKHSPNIKNIPTNTNLDTAQLTEWQTS